MALAGDPIYMQMGWTSVPPERLLKASLPIALYSVRSEHAFCEEFAYNLPCRWFLDMDLMERSFDATVFTKNGPRLLAHDAGRCIDDPNSRLLDNLQEQANRGKRHSVGTPSPAWRTPSWKPRTIGGTVSISLI